MTWDPSPNYSNRSTQDVRMVVVHEPVGGYEGSLAYIKRTSARVSYHALFNESCTKGAQLVRWSKKAWSCVRFNSRSDNISIAGKPENWTFSALNRLARVVAKRLEERNLPATFLRAPINPDNPPRGFTYHRELGAAGGGHSDPRFTRAQSTFFIAAVKFHRKYGRFRDQYGRD